ncbi:hypothetical protein B0T26DRAFT_694801 [Lasiosphaeria miniovina]|uniref:Lipid droplet-associated hydrolase n=1 Tax=Lasiosphaeria miniovina TaxID=1954250 RepID=A0AA40E844_9PEZI|nr:uncharacterized protein B0T26DRAFT_694801 [Lasiosphaeria miniovina]KAK0727506.1 hypothetical protein B0T26DRAFT_694801 [Lasiosphaeria miniovina]
MEDNAEDRSRALKTAQKVPFLEYPSSNTGGGRKRCLIYYITGNPGVVDFYIPFFTALRRLLDETEARAGCDRSFHIYSANLLGFDDADHDPFGSAPGTEPFVLEDQVRHCYDRLAQVNMADPASGQAEKKPFDEVILAGHSVGTYIAVELFHRHYLLRKAIRGGTAAAQSGGTVDGFANVNLKAGILLFATVTNIALSPSGKRMNNLRTSPFLNRNAHRIARRFLDLVPTGLLNFIVRRIVGHPPDAAAIVVRWLKSRDGLWQALHLGKDEMRAIAEENWSEDIWEIEEEAAAFDGGEDSVAKNAGPAEGAAETKTATATPGGEKFYIFFGRKDEWVAEKCRDEFISRRRQNQRGRTRIVIDEGNIPHDFCIKHSEEVAEKVKTWIDEIIAQ